MSFIRRKPRYQDNKQETRHVPAWSSMFSEEHSLFGGDTSSGANFDKVATRYLDNDLIFMGINRLAEIAAKMPLGLYLKDAAKKPSGKPDENNLLAFNEHPFYELWQQPNPWDSAYEFLYKLFVAFKISDAGVFVHLDDGREPERIRADTTSITFEGEPLALWMIERPGGMTVVKSKDSYIDHYLWESDDKRTKIKFAPNAIIHIKRWNPLDEFASVSDLRPTNYAVSSDIAWQRANYALLSNGLSLSAAVVSDRDRVDPAEIKLMEKMINEKYTGSPDKRHQIGWFWGGFEPKPWGMSMKDAEGLEAARQNRNRVLGTIGAHNALFLSEDVNLANAKVGELVTRSFGVDPVLTAIANEFTMIMDDLYPKQPPTEVHFIGVVPEDDRAAAEVELLQAQESNAKAEALTKLITILGPNAGVMLAKEWGLVPEDIGDIEPMTQQQSAAKAVVPVFPQHVSPVPITADDIRQAIVVENMEFPEYSGLLEANVNGND